MNDATRVEQYTLAVVPVWAGMADRATGRGQKHRRDIEEEMMGRNIVFGMAVVLLLLAGTRCQGQALPTAVSHVSAVAGGVSYSVFEPDYGTNAIKGLTGYVDVTMSRHWSVEVETHRLIYDTPNNMSEITYLGGPRYTLHYGFIEPYAKAMVGGAAFNYPTLPAQPQGKFFATAFGGGVDMPVGSRFTVRLVDFEYQMWPGFAISSLSPYGVSFGGSFTFWKTH